MVTNSKQNEAIQQQLLFDDIKMMFDPFWPALPFWQTYSEKNSDSPGFFYITAIWILVVATIILSEGRPASSSISYPSSIVDGYPMKAVISSCFGFSRREHWV